jgi:hypothetical protein
MHYRSIPDSGLRVPPWAQVVTWKKKGCDQETTHQRTRLVRTLTGRNRLGLDRDSGVSTIASAMPFLYIAGQRALVGCAEMIGDSHAQGLRIP